MGGQVTGDGLAFYFPRDSRVYVSHRAARDQPWTTPVELVELNAVGSQI